MFLIKSQLKWILKIVTLAVCLSLLFTVITSETLSRAGYAVSFTALALFVLIGIIFDIVGVAVTAAQEAPFHAMSSRKQPGAKQAILLIRNAEKVSSICNDVVGDICGIVSGTTSVLIVEKLIRNLESSELFLTLAISAAVTALTIGGKAAGKYIAIKKTTMIVLQAGKIIRIFSRTGSK